MSSTIKSKEEYKIKNEFRCVQLRNTSILQKYKNIQKKKHLKKIFQYLVSTICLTFVLAYTHLGIELIMNKCISKKKEVNKREMGWVSIDDKRRPVADKYI